MELENACYRVRLDRRGGICGLYDKRAGRELIAEPRLAESWRLLLPLPHQDLQPQVNYLLSTEQASPTMQRTAEGARLHWAGPLVNAQGAGTWR